MANKKQKINSNIGKKHAYIPEGYKHNPHMLNYQDFYNKYMYKDDFHGAALPEDLYDTARSFFEEMVGMGINPVAAVGMLGNISLESKFIPTAQSNFRGRFRGYTQNQDSIWDYMGKYYGHDHKGQLSFLRDWYKGELKGKDKDSTRALLLKRAELFRNDLATIGENDPYRYIKAANMFDDRYEVSDYAGKPYRLGYADWYGKKFIQDYPQYFGQRQEVQSPPQKSMFAPVIKNISIPEANENTNPVIPQIQIETPVMQEQPQTMNDYYLPEMDYAFNPFEGVFSNVAPDFGPVKLKRPGDNKKPLLFLT